MAKKCKKGTHKKGGRCVKNKRSRASMPRNCKTFVSEKNKYLRAMEKEFNAKLKEARAQKAAYTRAANAEARKRVAQCREATKAARA